VTTSRQRDGWRRWSAIVGVALAVAGFATAAYAVDTIFPDGDTGVASPNLAYGTGANAHACNTRGTAVAGEIRVDFNGNDPTNTTKHFQPGESLTVSLAPAAGSGITATPGTVPNVPATWGASQQDSFTIPISTTVPSTVADGSYAVEVTVTGQTSGYTAGDEAGTPAKPRYQVIVSCADAGGATNTAPSVAFASPPTSATEGDVKTFNFTITDPDSAETFSYAANSPNCGTLGNVVGTPSIDSTAKTGSFSCSFPDGLNPATSSNVSVQVSDGEALSNTASTSVTVANADPVVNSVTLQNTSGFPVACVTGNSYNLSLTFSDPGVIDNPWLPSVNWGDGNTDGAAVLGSIGAQTAAPPWSAGPYSHTYFAGSYAPVVTVTDKDNGSGSSASLASQPSVSLLYSTGAGILQPINFTGPRSLFKLGSTIPVKIKITDCINAPVSTLKPQVSLVKLDNTPDGTVVEDVVSTVPDQGTTMRFTGPPDYQYIYNLGTKNLTAGDYSVTIKEPTIAPVSAAFSLKK
jgi:hypothetical protein